MNFKEVYFNLWGQAWNFHKEFADMSETENDWQRAVDTSGAILKQYDGTQQHEFMKSLLMAVIDELERVDKSKRKQEDKKNEKEI